MSAGVLVAGEIYIDLLLGGFDHWPQPGEEAFARQFQREIGGGAAITACGLATLGTPTTVLGVIGAPECEWVTQRLSSHGVDVSMLRSDAAQPTGTTVAVTSPQDRAFFTYRGANEEFADYVGAASFEGARHVHFAWAPPFEVAPALLNRVRRAGATISLDAGWHPEWLADPRALSMFREIDVVFLNESEAAAVTRQTEPEGMMQAFAAATLRDVVIKLGANGSMLLTKGAAYHAPAIGVTPIDTTGAGDCFDAGFLHEWLRGGSPVRCLAAGNFCGALSTESYGGIASFPTRERYEQEAEL